MTMAGPEQVQVSKTSSGMVIYYFIHRHHHHYKNQIGKRQ